MPSEPVDTPQRRQALQHDASFLVQAPAGSGKTDLLTRRFLKLLTVVDEPEEILAITFTRAATAEMRTRILQDLEKASRGDATPEEERDALAQAALAHAELRGWKLLEQPHRLNIETIDSLSLRIAQNQPLLSRLGGRLSPTDNAAELYSQAAQRTMRRLDASGSNLDTALHHLLALRDNNLQNCIDLIARMLACRDQWLKPFPQSAQMSDDEWDQLRSALQQPLRDEVNRKHARIQALIGRGSALSHELLALAQYAIDHGNQKISDLDKIRELPEPGLVKHWECLANFLLTLGGTFRKRVDKNDGFPTATAEQRNAKKSMEKLLSVCNGIEGLQEAFAAVRKLPAVNYDEAQWTTLRHAFLALRHAVAELKVLFAERNVVDFPEVSQAARQVLSASSMNLDTLLAVSGNLRHLLVDEFQDTSFSQHELLTLLIQAWEHGDGRTVFLVGDPMQSVYLFRQAEVELFAKVKESGLESEHFKLPLTPLHLQTNFRSHAGLTTRWNAMFQAIFGAGGSIDYVETIAADCELPGESVHVYPMIAGQEGILTPDRPDAVADPETEKVVEIIRSHLPRIEEARQRGEEYRVAVLARVKKHLAKIAERLRSEGIPFRAVDLESLNQRQELLDLMSLTRALLHPMDRVAWFSVLRAPWCGVTMRDLHLLAGADDKECRLHPVLQLMEEREQLLSEDGASRVRRVSGILRQAMAVRYQGPYAGSFSQWIERTWRSLGGPACLDAAAQENVSTFFALLDALSPDGMACLTKDFDAQMDRLFAHPDPTVSERAGVQLMTIHKAKGLGFDVVIVPRMERKGRGSEDLLVDWLERKSESSGRSEILVAPIGGLHEDKAATKQWVKGLRKAKEREELKRLLYVACTRARRSLHLLGTVKAGKSGVAKPDSDSLLAVAWPALGTDFEEALAKIQKKVIEFPSQTPVAESLDLAAGGEPHPTIRLRRLTLEARVSPTEENVPFHQRATSEDEVGFVRPKGSRDARNKGIVVHALLEKLSRGGATDSLPAAARSMLRGLAYFGKPLNDAVDEVVAAVQNCLRDPDGAWILAEHRSAQSENSLTDWKSGVLKTLRPDRIFVAGAAPGLDGDDHLWIIDYKMSAPAGAADFLAQQRETYAPQLLRYERALREAQGINLPVCFGLYYPRIPRLDWWAAE